MLIPGNNRGYTLLEMMVTTFIVLMIFFSISTLLLSGVKSWREGENRVDVRQNVRIAMDRVAREVRQAAYLTTVIGYTNKTSPTYQPYYQKNLVFKDQNGQTVKYYLSNKQLIRGVGSATYEIAVNIQEINFYYEPSTADRVNQKMVTVNIVSTGKQNEKVKMESKIKIRSVK